VEQFLYFTGPPPANQPLPVQLEVTSYADGMAIFDFNRSFNSRTITSRCQLLALAVSNAALIHCALTITELYSLQSASDVGPFSNPALR